MGRPAFLPQSITKSANPTALIAYPAIMLGGSLGATAYNTAIRQSRNFGRRAYAAAVEASNATVPSGDFMDTVISRRILGMSEDELKDLQSDLLVEHLYKALFERKRKQPKKKDG